HLGEETGSSFDSHDEKLLIAVSKENHAGHNANETQRDLCLPWRPDSLNHSLSLKFPVEIISVITTNVKCRRATGAKPANFHPECRTFSTRPSVVSTASRATSTSTHGCR